MRLFVVGLIGFVLLTGCAEQRVVEAKAALTAGNADCNAQYPEKIGNYRNRASCYSDNVVVFNNRAYDGAYGDLLDIYNATRINLAGKVDRGEISRDDMVVELASLKSEQDVQINQRSAQAAAERQAVLIPMMQMQQQQQSQQQQVQQQLYQQQMNNIRTSNFQPSPTVNCLSNAFGNMMSTTCN